jgi:hypothetical protein
MLSSKTQASIFVGKNLAQRVTKTATIAPLTLADVNSNNNVSKADLDKEKFKDEPPDIVRRVSSEETATEEDVTTETLLTTMSIRAKATRKLSGKFVLNFMDAYKEIHLLIFQNFYSSFVHSDVFNTALSKAEAVSNR